MSIPFNPEIPAGTPVEVYWNLHKHVFSVRDRKTRRLIGHASEVHLTDVKFRVSEAGRRRVIQERRKNVHAFVQGNISASEMHLRGPIEDYVRARYNPYESAHFMDAATGILLAGAEFARLIAQQGEDGSRRGTVLLRREKLAL